MTETLRQKQSRFVRLTNLLVKFALDQGYELTYGETRRAPEQAKLNAARGAGIGNSLHNDGLAIDYNLFRDGKYLKTTAAHRPLGEYWESLAPDCCWGGRFKRNDGNHYSIEYQGRK